MKIKRIITIILLILTFFIISSSLFSQTIERFPKPDFQSDYQRPNTKLTDPETNIFIYIDVLLLIIALSLASFFALKTRSRKNLFILMLGSLIYFGFIKKGCICSVGALQNVSLALFQQDYLIPISVILFFLLPLIFTLFFGRTFCAAVCPFGAIQDIVVIKPVKVPTALSEPLKIIPYIYLGLSVLLAGTGTGFIICQYDPFVGFFRFSGNFSMIFLGISFLILGTVVARPYCRFFCPYGILLKWMSFLSHKHVKITPTECNNCRLCETSCPTGAILAPDDLSGTVNSERNVKRIFLSLVILPIIVFLSGWSFSRISISLSNLNPTISLAEEILIDTPDKQSDKIKAFKTTGELKEQLISRAKKISSQFHRGGWIIGLILGFIIALKMILSSIRRRSTEYRIDTGDCVSCARCFEYCPFEMVRLGLISPDEIPQFVVPNPETLKEKRDLKNDRK